MREMFLLCSGGFHSKITGFNEIINHMLPTSSRNFFLISFRTTKSFSEVILTTQKLTIRQYGLEFLSGFSINILRKSLNKRFGQPNNLLHFSCTGQSLWNNIDHINSYSQKQEFSRILHNDDLILSIIKKRRQKQQTP